MTSFVIVVTDGKRIRSFHPEALDHAERVTLERVVERRLEAVRRLENPEGASAAMAASPEVAARANGNGAAASSFRAAFELDRLADDEVTTISSEVFRALRARSSFEESGAIPKDQAVLMVQAEMARTAGFTGNVCAECGSFEMVRSGTCETCRACGKASGGCS